MAKKTNAPTHRANWKIDNINGVVLEPEDLIAIPENFDEDRLAKLVSDGALTELSKGNSQATVRDIPDNDPPSEPGAPEA